MNFFPYNNSPLERFIIEKDNFINYIVTLFKKCENMGNMIVPSFMLNFGLNSLRQTDPLELLEKFATKSYPYWDQILTRNDLFFVKNIDSIFGSGDSNADVFKKLLCARDKRGDRIIDNNERGIVWNHIHAMIRLAIEHIHWKRRPEQIIENGCRTENYLSDDYLRTIDIGSYNKRKKFNCIRYFPLKK